jgi:hypothetical protein
MTADSVAHIDLGSTIAVVGALVASLAASWYAWRFARTVGGELGAAFKWVMIGILLFAVTRVDDLMKTTGGWTALGIDYGKVILLPHSVLVVVAWLIIAFGLSRMAKAFSA